PAPPSPALFPYTTLFRSAASPFVGHTGELRLSFYWNGVRLVIEGGRIKSVDAWSPPRTAIGLDFSLPSADDRRPSAAFPDLTFRSEEHTSELQSRFDLVC